MLKLSAGAAAGLAIPGTHMACSNESPTSPTGDDGNGDTPPPPDPTQSVLPIPPRLEGSTFQLNMQPGQREFLPGLQTLTKGYNGDYLGPTLVVRSGSYVTAEEARY